MKDVILDEVTNQLNWKERLLFRLFKKTFIKIYRMGTINCFNFFNN